MTIIIHAQDLSGRMDDGYYTKPSLSEALDIFFGQPEAMNYFDIDAEEILSRKEAEEIFNQDKRVVFYNVDGEKVVISVDSSAVA